MNCCALLWDKLAVSRQFHENFRLPRETCTRLLCSDGNPLFLEQLISGLSIHRGNQLTKIEKNAKLHCLRAKNFSEWVLGHTTPCGFTGVPLKYHSNSETGMKLNVLLKSWKNTPARSH